MNRTFVALAAATALAGCGNPTTDDANGAAITNDMIGNSMAGANAAMTNAMASPVPDAPTDAAGYLAKAGAGDLFEIESSRALIARTANADARMFARMMIDAHTQSTAKVKAAAQEAGLTVAPPALDPPQQRMLDEIKAAPADKVDAIYYAHQSTAHAAALALHRHYASDGDTPALKKAAGEIVPVVEKHIAELDKLSVK